MKIASWNVNSLKVRLPQLLDWLEANQPDIVALQETKLTDENFPAGPIQAAGYQVLYAGQKTYNGVAIISRVPGTDVVTDLPGLNDPQRRVLAASFGSLRVLNVYIPNGQEVGTEKYGYKLDWLEKLVDYVQAQLAGHEQFVLLGDFNIAPDDADVHDPEAWRDKILCSSPERAAFQRLIQAGMHDSFRLFDQEANSFSWWDYRAAGFRRNLGLRIDLVLISDALKSHCRASYIDKAPRKLERPSDHAPAVADIDLS